jgi:hypothetical protein
MINDLLAETAIGIQSPLEYRWIKLVERPHRLPVPSAPTNCHQADSLMAGMRNSACWSSWMDGAITTDSAGFRDWRRDNISSEDDWLTLRYGWHDTVVESCLTAGNLFRVLRRRGYTGRLGCCRHCKP